jgi:DNA-binding SARP family transcriptional activator
MASGLSVVEGAAASLSPLRAPVRAGINVIRVLGDFRVDFAESAVDESVWRRVHARRLLQLLCSSTRLSESRAGVLEALWPDFDDARARNRLHHTIHWVRKSLEALPEVTRPQILVGRDRVELVLPSQTRIDVVEFERCLDLDHDDELARLRAIELALDWYAGELAPDWPDNPEVAARRVRLAEIHAKALNEAAQLAWELGLADRALEHAQRLAQLLEFDLDAQLGYATLLADQGRPDAALVHCRESRQALLEVDAGSAARLDQLERQIQQRVNRPRAPVGALPSAASTGQGAVASARPQLPEPVVILGYGRDRSAALQALRDPTVQIVTLAGPPGAGKSALAGSLARELAAEHRHGVVWIDCSGLMPQPDALLARLVSGLAGAGLVPSSPGDAAPLDVMARTLKGRELLVVVDGLEDASALEHELARLSNLGSDVRWLVTAWMNMRAPGERTIVLDPSQLVHADGRGGPSPACKLLLQNMHRAVSTCSAEDLEAAQALACELDGLPRLLAAAARWGRTGLLTELHDRIRTDPAAVLRFEPVVKQPEELPGPGLVRWLRNADPNVLQLLATLAQLRSWLTREDMACLLGDLDETRLHGLIDGCVRHHFLLRRVRRGDHSTWSEFRVPRYVVAALAYAHAGELQHDCARRVERLFLRQGRPDRLGEGHDPAQRLAWFDDRFDDFEALVLRLQQQLDCRSVAALCLAQAGFLRRPRHARKALSWLEWLGGPMDGLDAAASAALLVERSELRVQMGNFVGACEDACRALAHMAQGSNLLLEARARKIVERYGNSQERQRWPRAMSQRGLEAGEALLRVAQLAARHGALGKALQLCGQAEGVFGYFELRRGLLRTYQSEAKFSFRIGQPEAAHRYLALARSIAVAMSDSKEVARCDLMLADVLLSEQEFPKALDVTGRVLAQLPGTAPPLLLKRGLIAMGWAHYALGTMPVARALSREVEHAASGPSDPATAFEVGMLASMLDARRGDPGSARRRLRTALDLIGRESVFVDPQGELINVAELAVAMRRADVASSALAELHRFDETTGQRLRPWVRARAHALSSASAPAAQGLLASEGRGESIVRAAIDTLASAPDEPLPLQAFQ